MAYRWRAKGLLSKLGVTYGTDAVPTGAANAMLPIDVNIQPLDAREITRGIELPYLGNNGKILVEQKVKMNFKTELAGSGTPLGTAAPYGVLLRSCGMAEVLTATTKAEYNPVTNGQEWSDHYFYLANTLHKALGARGNAKINLPANDLPTIEWDLMALASAITGGTAAPALTLTPWKVPIPATKTNTPTATLGGVNLVSTGINIDLGNDVQYRGLIGAETVEIGDRNVTGSIEIEAPDVAVQDWFTNAKNRTRQALSITHGTVAGNIVQITAPQVEVGAPQYGNRNGFVMMTLPLTFVPQNGNDEIKLTLV